MLKILNVFKKILDVIMASGRERRKISIINVIYMAFAVLCAWGIYKLAGLISAQATNADGGCSCDNAGQIVGYALAIFLCATTGLYALIAGLVSQVVLVVFAFLGCFFSRERGANFVALLIAILSLGAATVGGLFLFGIF